MLVVLNIVLGGLPLFLVKRRFCFLRSGIKKRPSLWQGTSVDKLAVPPLLPPRFYGNDHFGTPSLFGNGCGGNGGQPRPGLLSLLTGKPFGG